MNCQQIPVWIADESMDFGSVYTCSQHSLGIFYLSWKTYTLTSNTDTFGSFVLI